jgi:hypothetical protein
MTPMDADEASRLWETLAAAVRRYGFGIEHKPLEPPRLGIFNGLTITIDPKVGREMQCFLLLHLFGHSVQWVAPSLEGSLDALRHSDDMPRFLRALDEYERGAAAYGMQLLHEAGVRHLDQWYADFVETDWRYVERYYRTGVIPAWSDCVVSGMPLVAPLPIPPLKHREVEVRFAF